jgi:hypothetical protein
MFFKHLLALTAHQEFSDSDMICQFMLDKRANDDSASARVSANSTVVSSRVASSHSSTEILPPHSGAAEYEEALSDCRAAASASAAAAAAANSKLEGLRSAVLYAAASAARLLKAEESMASVEAQLAKCRCVEHVQARADIDILSSDIVCVCALVYFKSV